MMTVDLFEVLDSVWQTLCQDYDVCADLPDIGDILSNVNTSKPESAAQNILLNLLSEVMENTNRFSPWYHKPASAFGVQLQTGATGKRRWALSHEAVLARHDLLKLLSNAIDRNQSVILAISFLDSLEPTEEIDVPCQAARCQCIPPRIILIQQGYAHPLIVCDNCKHPFQ